jgi:hypothetical protein
MVGLCLAKQNRRHNSELGVYLQAIRYRSNRPEAYYFISLLHERKKEWLESHVNASISLSLKNNACDTVYDFGWREYKCVFQKAVSSWWIGQIDLSSDLFYELADKYGYDLNESHKESVLNNINFLNLYNHKHLVHNYNLYDKLKFKFKDSNLIERNYSQVMQDMFVLTMLDGKKSGTYLEIGYDHAFYGSNTALLDKIFNWKGISIDHNKSYKDSYNDRNSIYINDDVLSIDYQDLLSKYNFNENIDYLQLDCVPPVVNFDVLKNIPFDKYNFAVITYKHDSYTDINSNYRELSREYLTSKGYELIVNNVAPDRLCSFQDWWVHPDLVDRNIINNFKVISNLSKKPTDFMYI